MASPLRSRRKIHLPITLSVSLMALNVMLMVGWIVLLSQWARWTTLTFGVVAFTIILAGLSVWLVLSLKEIALNNRQANFVDSVTHELKSPIAALQLYLETLRMRNLSEEKRQEFHGVMASELHRLDQLINQLLEVGRLDAIGENEEPADLELDGLMRQFAHSICAQWKVSADEVFTFATVPVMIHVRKIVLDMILANLLENAVKYAGDPPRVDVRNRLLSKGRVQIRISNNGSGVPREDRKKIFQIFYRGGSELERRRKGTGLGLYIVQTLVRKLHGRIYVHDRSDGRSGCTFVLELPGCRAIPAATTTSPEPDSLVEMSSSQA